MSPVELRPFARNSEDLRSILHPQAVGPVFRLDRYRPGPPLDRFVHWFWFVSWDLPEGRVHDQYILAQPAVNVTVGTSEAFPPRLTGVQQRRSLHRLTGTGSVVGVTFRPGGFRPWCPGPVGDLTGRVLPVRDLLPDLASALEHAGVALSSGAGHRDVAAIAAEPLAARVPTGRHPCEDTRDWAEHVAADRSLVHAGDLASVAGVGSRTLQRRFHADVGVGPKWVIRRYRLCEVAERARHGPVDWAELAVRLGYSDQSHLVRDFTDAVGEPPARYARATSEPEPAR